MGHGVSRLGVGGFRGVHFADAGVGSLRSAPRCERGLLPRGSGAERVLGLACSAFWHLGLDLGGADDRGRILRRLHFREGALGGQRLCLRSDLCVLRRTRAVSVPDSVMGVVGASALRVIFTLIGAELLETYDWVVYLFGVFLTYTGIRMARHSNQEVHPERNPVIKLLRRILPMTDGYRGQNLLVRERGRLMATPLLAVLIAVETTDVVFAVDSIPAIFAITTNTFVVWTSNAFAILGLRALYFMLAGLMQRFVYLSLGLSVVLVFVGAKFIWSDLFGKVPIWVSLPFIATVVAVSIAASLWKTRGKSG